MPVTMTVQRPCQGRVPADWRRVDARKCFIFKGFLANKLLAVRWGGRTGLPWPWTLC